MAVCTQPAASVQNLAHLRAFSGIVASPLSSVGREYGTLDSEEIQMDLFNLPAHLSWTFMWALRLPHSTSCLQQGEGLTG